MPFLSRFKKGKSAGEDLEEGAEDLEAGGEDGLLMTTGGGQGAPAEAEAAGQDGDLDTPAAVQDEAAALELDEAAQPQGEVPEGEAAAPADPLVASEEEQPDQEAEAGEEAGGVSEGGSDSDDLLSAFRSEVAESQSNDLTDDLEDIPIADIVAELREVRAMLPPTPPEAENDEG